MSYSPVESAAPSAARRTALGRWRNRRLALGVSMILGSAVIGGWLLATARDATDYWLVREHVKAGQPIEAGQLAVVSGRIEQSAADALLRADEGVPAGVWARDLAPGTLATRDSATAQAEPSVGLPLSVEVGALPPDLERGDRIDVWSAPRDGGAGAVARRILAGVAVDSVTGEDGTGRRTVVVDVGEGGPSSSVVAAAGERLTAVRVR